MSPEGIRLKEFIGKVGLKQKDLAEETELDPADISRFIKGKAPIPLWFLRHLHAKYKLNYEWFLEGSGKMKATDKEPKLVQDLAQILDMIKLIEAMTGSLDKKVNKIAAEFYDLRKKFIDKENDDKRTRTVH